MPVKNDPTIRTHVPNRVGATEPVVEQQTGGKAKGVINDDFARTGGTANIGREPPMPGSADPIASILDALGGAAFGEGANEADLLKELEKLKQMAGAVSPQQQMDMMKELGLDVGASMTDPKTVDAVKQLQDAAGLFPSGQMDLETLLALVEATNNKRQSTTPGSRASSGGSGAARGAGGGGPSGEASGSAGSYVPRRGNAEGVQGSSSPGTAPTGTLKANQKQAYDAAIKEGLSPTAAKALVANMTGESLSKPNDNHWDVHHMSQGIVQWDPQRSAAIKRQFGKEPKDMTVAEQTKAAIWEMKNNPAYRQTWNALQGNDAHAMVSALVRNYERPANPEGEINKRMGNYNQLGHLNA